MQHWELLPAQAALNVRVGSIGGGSLGFPEFPKWLGNYSRENKRRRLLGELTTHLNASVSGGTEVSRGTRPPPFLAILVWRPPRSRAVIYLLDTCKCCFGFGASCLVHVRSTPELLVLPRALFEFASGRSLLCVRVQR